jgi:hypothetical protein
MDRSYCSCYQIVKSVQYIRLLMSSHPAADRSRLYMYHVTVA